MVKTQDCRGVAFLFHLFMALGLSGPNLMFVFCVVGVFQHRRAAFQSRGNMVVYSLMFKMALGKMFAHLVSTVCR